MCDKILSFVRRKLLNSHAEVRASATSIAFSATSQDSDDRLIVRA